MDKQEKVTLYTRQHEHSLYELESKGRITNKEIYIRLHMMDLSTFFLDKYRTFVALAEKRLPRPEGIDFPIWCSTSEKSCLRPMEKEVVYVLHVPKDQVIYFDGGKWDYVLNDLYIPRDEEDKLAYEELVDSLGVKDQFNFIGGKYKGMYPEMEKKIRDSWERIFEIQNWNEFIVQGNLWQIKKEWVQRIVRPGEEL